MTALAAKPDATSQPARQRNRGGRPRDPGSERSREPWREAGVSQRTFYRRKARAGAASPAGAAPPVQHSAHVVAWLATLAPIAMLEHRAFVRRCLRGLA